MIDPNTSAQIEKLESILMQCQPEPCRALDEYRSAARILLSTNWRVLISGLCSVGKSSFICGLWGDATLVPTAVRDCTQTNTAIHASKDDTRQAFVRYLQRDEALQYARSDLSFYRLKQFLEEHAGPLGPKLDELPAAEALTGGIAWVEEYFRQHPQSYILNEYLTDEIEKLREFLTFIASEPFEPGALQRIAWSERQRYLMGERKPDGRPGKVGPLLACREAQLHSPPKSWSALGDHASVIHAPILVDSPWIPTFKDARRKELILQEALQADVLVLIFLPERIEPEAWVLEAWRRRPELLERTWIVFNQIDTVELETLFGRGGFAEAYEQNEARFRALGISSERLLLSCARLPFLRLLQSQGASHDSALNSRIDNLESALCKLRNTTERRGRGVLKDRLLSALNDGELGLQVLRNSLNRFAQERLVSARKRELLSRLSQLEGFGGVTIPVELKPDWLSAKNALQSALRIP